MNKVNLLILFRSLNLWLHLISLSLWLGAIVFFLIVFAPAVHTLKSGTGIQVLDKGRRALHLLSWIAIIILLISGVGNFILRGAQSGFQFAPGYYAILGIKFFFVLAMILHQSLQSFKYASRIASLTGQTAPDVQAWPEPLLAHWQKWFVLLKINAALGVIVLVLGLALSKS